MEKEVHFGFLPIIYEHYTSGNMDKGKKLFSAGHVMCLVEKADKISAKVLRQTSVSKKPYFVILWLDNTRRVTRGNCECIAGVSGHCKHISAVVFAINEEDSSSKTDQACNWKQPLVAQAVKGKYSKGTKIKEMFCLKKELKKYEPYKFTLADLSSIPCMLRDTLNAENSEEIIVESVRWYNEKNYCQIKGLVILDIDIYSFVIFSFFCLFFFYCRSEEDQQIKDFFEALILRQESSEILNELYTKPIQLRRACCLDTYNRIIFGNSADICFKTFSDKNLWAKERRFRITASRCYSVFTYSKDWENKCQNYFFPRKFTSKYTEHGIKWERYARTAYCRKNNVVVEETGLVVCQGDTWLAVSPDGIVMDGNSPKKLLEIKCPFTGISNTATEVIKYCSYLHEENGQIKLKKRHAYYTQIQICMAVLNLQSCDFIIFASLDSTFVTINVEFDYEWVKEVLFKVKENYTEEMLHFLCVNINKI